MDFSILGINQNPHRYGPEQPVLEDSYLGRIGGWQSPGLFQLQLFYDNILLLYSSLFFMLICIDFPNDGANGWETVSWNSELSTAEGNSEPQLWVIMKCQLQMFSKSRL